MTSRFAALTRPARSRRPGGPGVVTVLAFLLPGLALYGLVYLYPVLSALSYSFYRWEGIRRVGFSGLDNYRAVVSLQPYADRFAAALAHNLAFFVGTLVLQGVVGFLLALALERTIRGRRFFQTVYSLPYLMSSLVVGYLWSLMLAPGWGVVNALFTAVGLDSLNRPWLGDPHLVMPVLVLINCWQWVGLAVLIFGAALSGVPHEQLEAARLDGAGYWNIVRRVQLPQVLGSIQLYTLLIFIGAFNAFDLIYAVGGSGGGPGGAADVLGTLFYRIAFDNDLNALGLSGALAVLMLLMILAASLLIIQGFERWRKHYEE